MAGELQASSRVAQVSSGAKERFQASLRELRARLVVAGSLRVMRGNLEATALIFLQARKSPENWALSALPRRALVASSSEWIDPAAHESDHHRRDRHGG